MRFPENDPQNPDGSFVGDLFKVLVAGSFVGGLLWYGAHQLIKPEAGIFYGSEGVLFSLAVVATMVILFTKKN